MTKAKLCLKSIFQRDQLRTQSYAKFHRVECTEIFLFIATWLSYHVARVTGFPYKDKTSSVGVGGTGMDMGFHVVSTLASVLYDDYKAIKQEWI